MKLSNKNELLNYADSVLETIRGSIQNNTVNEIDWERHEKMYKKGGKGLQSPDIGTLLSKNPESSKEMQFLVYKLESELAKIENKYRDIPQDKTNIEKKKKEIDDIIDLVDKLRNHLMSFDLIPRDPKKQTEIQKAIVAAPTPSFIDIGLRRPSSMVKDPKTGMYWTSGTGVPILPPDIDKEFRDYMTNIILMVPQYDHTRGWFYNFMKKFFSGIWG